MPSNRSWLAALSTDLTRQRRSLQCLLEFCEESSLATSLSVGCSLGRNAADALSDVDAAIGVLAPCGTAGVEQVRGVERAIIDLLPTIGTLVDVLRQETASHDFVIRRVFAQFEDRLQLDLAVVAEAEVRRGDAAPDFVPLYWSEDPETAVGPSAIEVSREQLQDWSFLGWRALLDADKYLQRGSLWEAHQRLHEARDRIWALWAAANGATYPWHGLSQVLDQDPCRLPAGIDQTVAGLESDDLRRAVMAAADLLEHASSFAAQQCGVRLDMRMAGFAHHALAHP